MTDGALDPVIHAPARLRIVVTLATLPAGDTLTFTRLQDLIGLTPGNLITHLRKLETENYIRSEKVVVNRKPKTWFQITADGRRALERLFRQLEELLTQAG